MNDWLDDVWFDEYWLDTNWLVDDWTDDVDWIVDCNWKICCWTTCDWINWKISDWIDSYARWYIWSRFDSDWKINWRWFWIWFFHVNSELFLTLRNFWFERFLQFISYDRRFVAWCNVNLNSWFRAFWTNRIVLFAANECSWSCFADRSIKSSADEMSLNDRLIFRFVWSAEFWINDAPLNDCLMFCFVMRFESVFKIVDNAKKA